MFCLCNIYIPLHCCRRNKAIMPWWKRYYWIKRIKWKERNKVNAWRYSIFYFRFKIFQTFSFKLIVYGSKKDIDKRRLWARINPMFYGFFSSNSNRIYFRSRNDNYLNLYELILSSLFKHYVFENKVIVYFCQGTW